MLRRLLQGVELDDKVDLLFRRFTNPREFHLAEACAAQGIMPDTAFSRIDQVFDSGFHPQELVFVQVRTLRDRLLGPHPLFCEDLDDLCPNRVLDNVERDKVEHPTPPK
jgi:hypothetical protein